MDKNTLEHFREKLLDEKSRYKNTLHLMEDNGNGEQDRFSSGELSNYDNHPADLGTEVFQVELNQALIVNEEYNISQINEALAKIEDGSFGKCEVCGFDIDNERLEALPFARRCMECEKNQNVEQDNNVLLRPNEERVIDAPFGRKYLNRQEDDEYEGLDYLNDVMKYGSADSPQDMGGYGDYDDFYTTEVDRQGLVEDVENISNEQYKKQLPD